MEGLGGRWNDPVLIRSEALDKSLNFPVLLICLKRVGGRAPGWLSG